MTTIITKNSSTASSVPVAGDLTKGELAVNVTDKKLYTKDNGGSVVKLVGSLGNQEASAVAITGGTIDGTPIGGTTASTASFTTVSASGNVTLSGGTANGVLYLNGSKVATSGSALTFDGSKLSITNSGEQLRLIGNGTTGYIRATDGTNNLWYIGQGGAAGLQLYTYDTNPIGFYVNTTEAMRLTSTGLGIGTSFPAYKLDVLGTSRIYQSGNAAASLMLNANQGTISTGYAFTLAQSSSAGNYNFTISEGATTYLTLTNSISGAGGNLGLGVTPSAWATVTPVLEMKNGVHFATLNTTTPIGYLGANAYYNGSNWIYKTSSQYAVRYELNAGGNGSHAWFTAASGTAGDAITFTQAMTLTAGGNLALGTTSPTEISNYVSQTLNGSSGSFTEYRQNGANTLRVGSDSGGGFIFTQSTTAIKFGTNDVERARIDSSGNFCYGVSSFSAANNGFLISSNGASTYTAHASGTPSGGVYSYFYYADNIIGSISQSGTTAVLYNTTSDQRLKENIVDADSASALIDSLQVRKFDWKTGEHQRYGFIAQELVTVAPEAVHQPADPEQMMAVDYSKLVPMLVKEIQSLRARVAQLESN